MNKEDELKLKELRDNRDTLNKQRVELDDQIRVINKQIDNIYFKDSNISKYLGHIIYFYDKIDHHKHLIWIKDIMRLYNNNVRLYGPSISWYDNEDFYYENQETIDINQDELIKCIICDHLQEKFTHIQIIFKDIMNIELGL